MISIMNHKKSIPSFLIGSTTYFSHLFYNGVLISHTKYLQSHATEVGAFSLTHSDFNALLPSPLFKKQALWVVDISK